MTLTCYETFYCLALFELGELFEAAAPYGIIAVGVLFIWILIK